MKHLRIKSVKDIEKAIWLFYRYLPMPHKKPREALAKAYPYLAVCAGTYLLSVAILPYIFTNYPLDPLFNTGLFNFNILLSRVLFALMGIIVFVSFERLVQKNLVGWYNMFYLSLFHMFFLLVVFSPYSLLILLVAWYLLFAIKPEYS